MTEFEFRFQAVNKLAEVMQQRSITDQMNGTARSRKVSTADQRKREKEVRKLQQDLIYERQQFSQEIEKLKKDLNETQAALTDESSMRLSLQMELDSKDAENEQLRARVKAANFDSVSQNSGSGGFEDDETLGDIRFEGWLSIPNQRNARRLGYWKKQLVVVSSKKILFYDSEIDKDKSIPHMVLDMRYFTRYLYHNYCSNFSVQSSTCFCLLLISL